MTCCFFNQYRLWKWRKNVDVLVLNTAVVDFRRDDFDFADKLVGRGGLAKCRPQDRPGYTQQQLADWIDQGCAAAGGPGNCAPLIAKSGLKVAVAVNLGKGDCDGLDAPGRFFHDVMTANNVDMSAVFVHPELPTGTTYIHNAAGAERGGIAYFADANDDFDFEIFKKAVERLSPKIVYYMYSGLSKRGDANDGRDLAQFMKWCTGRGIVTIADSSTLTPNPEQVIRSGKPVPAYRLLEPLMPELDVFFTSSDEAKMIENTLSGPRKWDQFSENENNMHFLEFLTEKFWHARGRTSVFGVTVSDGAYEKHISPNGKISGTARVESRFMAGGVIDLVGAGDSFRAGLISYMGHNLEQFQKGSMNFTEAVQMANLFAAIYIKSPLTDRHNNIRNYKKMLEIVHSSVTYPNFESLKNALG